MLRYNYLLTGGLDSILADANISRPTLAIKHLVNLFASIGHRTVSQSNHGNGNTSTTSDDLMVITDEASLTQISPSSSDTLVYSKATLREEISTGNSVLDYANSEYQVYHFEKGHDEPASELQKRMSEISLEKYADEKQPTICKQTCNIPINLSNESPQSGDVPPTAPERVPRSNDQRDKKRTKSESRGHGENDAQESNEEDNTTQKRRKRTDYGQSLPQGLQYACPFAKQHSLHRRSSMHDCAKKGFKNLCSLRYKKVLVRTKQ